MHGADFGLHIAYHICIVGQILVVVLLEVVKTQFDGSFQIAYHIRPSMTELSIDAPIEVKDNMELYVRMFSMKTLLLSKESSTGGGVGKESNLT